MTFPIPFMRYLALYFTCCPSFVYSNFGTRTNCPKLKEKIRKARWLLNIKKTKPLTTEELHDFDVNSEETEMAKQFLLYTLVQSCIEMDIAVKKSENDWNLERCLWKN